MKKISKKLGVILIKYVLVLVFCMLSALALIFSPDLYRFSDLNFGPCLAILGVGAGTLIWNSIDD